VTPLGRLLASALMLTGYGIIAVPTGIVTAELVAQDRRGPRGTVCPGCSLSDHDADAQFCKRCGQSLEAGVA
jgi:voltage-gated potassium channel